MRRAHVYLAEVEHSDLTCGDHFIGVYASEQKAKKAIREAIRDFGGKYREHLVWRDNGASKDTHTTYTISTDWTAPGEYQEYNFSIIVTRPQ